MKETAKSLRAYFLLAGIAGGYSNGTSLLASPGVVVLALNVLSLLAALAFLYVAAVLPTLLAQAPQRIYVVLAFTGGVSLVHGVLLLAVAPSGIGIGVCVGALLICFYLYRNVKRLAADARALPAAG
jgi:hypothetical protein